MGRRRLGDELPPGIPGLTAPADPFLGLSRREREEAQLRIDLLEARALVMALVYALGGEVEVKPSLLAVCTTFGRINVTFGPDGSHILVLEHPKRAEPESAPDGAQEGPVPATAAGSPGDTSGPAVAPPAATPAAEGAIAVSGRSAREAIRNLAAALEDPS